MSEQNKKVLQLGIAIGLIGLIGAVYMWFIWASGVVDAESKAQIKLHGEIQSVQLQLAQIKNKPTIEKEIGEKNDFLQRAMLRLPSTKEDTGFMTSLSDMLHKSSVNVKGIRAEDVAARSNYTEIPWHVSAIAEYIEFGLFLNLVEENPQRLMRVKTFNLTNDPQLPGYHPLDVEIGTFMFNQ